MKIRIFVLTYDDETRKFAEEWTAGLSWATVVHNKTTIYLENLMYSSWLLEHIEQWRDCDYVGTLSWKTPRKIAVPDMQALVSHLTLRNPDVVPFFPCHEPILLQGERHHPLFRQLWCELTRELGISEDQATAPAIPLFFCNYWMARPSWMLRYMEFFKKAQHVLDTCETLQAKLWTDSRFDKAISDEKCMEIFGKPYYPYHCFLCERLPCLFFKLEGAVVWHPYTRFDGVGMEVVSRNREGES